jgi:hypothetical protein
MIEKRRIGWILIVMAGILLVTLLAAELPIQDTLPAQEMVMSNESIAGEIGGGILPREAYDLAHSLSLRNAWGCGQKGACRHR